MFPHSASNYSPYLSASSLSSSHPSSPLPSSSSPSAPPSSSIPAYLLLLRLEESHVESGFVAREVRAFERLRAMEKSAAASRRAELLQLLQRRKEKISTLQASYGRLASLRAELKAALQNE
eukprot:GHVT01013991.1.p1 GENE.GHVT01013991.1~~GHVT01013991.1.p1  ORF type:complete len:121 (-),score=40.48 GHVT01013991.1:674-1036(-)